MAVSPSCVSWISACQFLYCPSLDKADKLWFVQVWPSSLNTYWQWNYKNSLHTAGMLICVLCPCWPWQASPLLHSSCPTQLAPPHPALPHPLCPPLYPAPEQSLKDPTKTECPQITKFCSRESQQLGLSAAAPHGLSAWTCWNRRKGLITPVCVVSPGKIS